MLRSSWTSRGRGTDGAQYVDPAALAALLARLHAEGYAEAVTLAPATRGADAREPYALYDAALAGAVAAYQQRHGLDADSVIGPDGAGTAFSLVHDDDGPVGRVAQALTVRPR